MQACRLSHRWIYSEVTLTSLKSHKKIHVSVWGSSLSMRIKKEKQKKTSNTFDIFYVVNVSTI